MRLTQLQAQRKEIQQRLGNSDERIDEGAAVLAMQLDLLQDPQELYRQLSDHGRRLLNQATFEKLLIDQDRDEPTIRVATPTYTEPVRELMLAARAYREQLGAAATANANRPTVNGEPVRGTLADLLTSISLDRGWSKTAMVGRRQNWNDLWSWMFCGRLFPR
jgi:hypothetical protein